MSCSVVIMPLAQRDKEASSHLHLLVKYPKCPSMPTAHCLVSESMPLPHH